MNVITVNDAETYTNVLGGKVNIVSRIAWDVVTDDAVLSMEHLPVEMSEIASIGRENIVIILFVGLKIFLDVSQIVQEEVLIPILKVFQ